MNYLGQFLVQQGVITKEQLDDALRYQGEMNKRLGEVAMAKGALTKKQVQTICSRQKEDARLFGDIAVEERHLSRKALDDLLFLQKVHYTYLGEALLLKGYITSEQYSLLMREHYEMADKRRVSLRYIQEFFAENKILSILTGAMGLALRRFVGETFQVERIGEAFTPESCHETVGVVAKISGNRAMAALFCLSEPVGARIDSAQSGAHGLSGLESFSQAVVNYFGSMLRDDGFLLEDAELHSIHDLPALDEDAVFVRLGAPCGMAGVLFGCKEACQ